MKCCKCNKEVDTSSQANPYPPPTWFAKHQYDKMVRLICADCIKQPENKDWWK